ncbi:hypothetical protein FRB91_007658, partial [Serendipita sp. 411]
IIGERIAVKGRTTAVTTGIGRGTGMGTGGGEGDRLDFGDRYGSSETLISVWVVDWESRGGPGREPRGRMLGAVDLVEQVLRVVVCIQQFARRQLRFLLEVY